MRKLILKMSISLDGFVGGPGGEIDWLFDSMDEGATQWTVELLWKAGVHAMGSRTFHDMASYWPYSDEPFAAPMNQIPKVVFSRSGAVAPPDAGVTTAFRDATRARPTAPSRDSPQRARWETARVARGDLAGEIARLKQEPGKDILAHGGAGFAQSLVRLGLVDEYQLLVHPVALGRGLALFSSLSGPLRLKLVSATAFGAGAVAKIYRPA
jgi:dihydrofolate reductase